MIKFDDLVDITKRYEGFRTNAYIDPLQVTKFTKEEVKWFYDNRDKMNITIGYGTLMEDIDEEMAILLLKHRLKLKINEVNKEFAYLDINESLVWDMLYLMSYQLGVAGIKKFKNMLQAIKEKKYKEVYKQALDSLWYKQTPKRALEVVGIIKPLLERI